MSDPLFTRAMSRLQLNPREKQLRGLLVDVATFVDESTKTADATSSNGAKREPTVLRWAGGWVRDKVLGTDSHDIDVAINTMTGYNFATMMQKYCEVPTNRVRHGMSEHDLGNLHKVKKNPEKSKNLETGTTTIFGLEVDFVNLRKEVYKGDSRNPEMEFGTAEEDAERRDATINALFFNLQTGELEDFTGGLQDMEAKVIRTPLEPFKTFWDDPLRVVRLVRFASRLNFTVDPATERAMADTRIVDRFRAIITRERVGQEMDKMFKGKRPRSALELIDRIGLYHTVFTDPAKADSPRPDITGWHRAYDCLEYMSGEQSSTSLYNNLVRSEEDKYLAWVLAAIIPCEQIPDEAVRVSKKSPPFAVSAAREGIKATNHVISLITAAHRDRSNILELKESACKGDKVSQERDRFGMAIRQWDSLGGHWRLQVLYALLFEVLQTPDGGSEAGRDRVLACWQKFLAHLQKLDLMDAASMKPLVDGKQLQGALGLKPGPWLADALKVTLAWQFRNPDKTDPSGAIEEARKHVEELGVKP